jgi:hypothetical protein
MTNLLHSAHDRPDFPLRVSVGEEVEQVVDGPDVLMVAAAAKPDRDGRGLEGCRGESSGVSGARGY